MMRKPKKVRAARHRRWRKHYAVTVTKEVHTILHAIARNTGETVNAVIARSLLPTRGGA